MTESLESQFARVKATHSDSIHNEAHCWAGWLIACSEELGPFSDILALNEYEDEERWNSAQRKLLFVLSHLKQHDLRYSELYQLITDIGDVDEIWQLCFDHICYMAAFRFIAEDAVDKILEDVKGCERCSPALSAFIYQFVPAGSPLTLQEVWEIAHVPQASTLYSFIRLMENDEVFGLGTFYKENEKELIAGTL